LVAGYYIWINQLNHTEKIMLDLVPLKEANHQFYAAMSTDPSHFTINAVTGPFRFSSHSTVPQLVQALAMELYPDALKFSRIKLELVEAAINEVWEGPGSAAKVSDIIWDMRLARRADPNTTAKDVFKGLETPTIDSELDITAED
jgi:hypothetical protein